MKLSYTRAMINAILGGTLKAAAGLVKA